MGYTIMPAYLRVKNWAKFQHYKHRNPPWIKLHYETLSSEDWVTLSDASKLLAVVCMLLASRNDGLFLRSEKYIKRVAYIEGDIDFQPLIDCGFLISEELNASTLQADARPEGEAELETEKKTEPPITPQIPLKPIFRPTNNHATLGEWMKASDKTELPDTWFALIRALKVPQDEIQPRATRFLERYLRGKGMNYTSDNWGQEFWKWFAEKPGGRA